MNVDSAVGESTVPVEELRLALTVLQGKQWQREEELPDQTVIGVSLNYLVDLLPLSIYLSISSHQIHVSWSTEGQGWQTVVI